MSKQYYTEFSVRTNEMRSRSSQRKKADTGSPSRYWFSSVSVYVSVMQNGKPNTSDLKAKSDLIHFVGSSLVQFAGFLKLLILVFLPIRLSQSGIHTRNFLATPPSQWIHIKGRMLWCDVSMVKLEVNFHKNLPERICRTGTPYCSFIHFECRAIVWQAYFKMTHVMVWYR